MWIRSLFGGFFIIIGCSATVLIIAAMLLSMQLESGTGLLYGVAGLGAGLASLALGTTVLLFRR